MEFEMNEVYWSWAYLMADQIKSHKDEMKDTFSHNKPYYVGGRPIVTMFPRQGRCVRVHKGCIIYSRI